jgi:hypothetical protein
VPNFAADGVAAPISFSGVDEPRVEVEETISRGCKWRSSDISSGEEHID